MFELEGADVRPFCMKVVKVDLLFAIVGLLDGTLVALLGVPVFRELLVGSLLLALTGMFLLLRGAAGQK